ncbi:MAG: hypothetical protein HRU07_01275 [Nitrosopumilus sp.]|nr:hypothetical protein [Nitrosopumilus sp.]NRA04805.1 hypothetical protein [Nitrosopumilus sp.]
MESEEFQKHILARVEKLERNESAREQAEKISNGESENHFNGERTLESATQRVKAFYQNYDEGSVGSLYGSEIDSYHKEAKIIEMLIEKYSLQQLSKDLRK